MNRFCSVTECHVCCYLTNILNSPATVGSAAKGHTSLGHRAPFPLLLAWEVGCFGDGTHDNFGDALWSLLWGRFAAAADSTGNSPLWCAQLLWHFFKLMSWRDQRQNSSGKSELSVQMLNVARPNFFFAICLVFADKLPLLMAFNGTYQSRRASGLLFFLQGAALCHKVLKRKPNRESKTQSHWCQCISC